GGAPPGVSPSAWCRRDPALVAQPVQVRDQIGADVDTEPVAPDRRWQLAERDQSEDLPLLLGFVERPDAAPDAPGDIEQGEGRLLVVLVVLPALVLQLRRVGEAAIGLLLREPPAHRVLLEDVVL